MSAAPHDSDARLASLGAPRFSLATLLLAMSAVSVLFAVMVVIGPVSSVLLVLLVSLAAAHVIGNAMGTALRDGARDFCAEPPEHAAKPRAHCPQQNSAPLVKNTGVSRALRVLTLLGAGAGAFLGGSGLALANWERINVAGICLAAVSSAVLAGVFVFLTASFFTTARHALRDALGTQDKRAGET